MSKQSKGIRLAICAVVAVMLGGGVAYSRLVQSGGTHSAGCASGFAIADESQLAQRPASVQKPDDLRIISHISPTPKYAWSREKQVYHYYQCFWVTKIKPENLQTGDVPPEGRRLHRGCPTKE